jgi:Kef-type K+ transport system membrane component KefB
VGLTLAFFTLPILFVPGYLQKLAGMAGNILHRSNPIAFQLVVMLALTGLASFMGVSPIFGAPVAGILAGDLQGDAERARQSIQAFAYA